MMFLGIDPGNEGALALIDDNEKIVALYPMPSEVLVMVKKGKKSKRHRVDWLMVWAWLKKNCPDPDQVRCAIEHFTPTQNQRNTMTIENYGRLLMQLELRRFTYTPVFPITWRSTYSGMFPFDKITELPPAMYVAPKDAKDVDACAKRNKERLRKLNYDRQKERLMKIAKYHFHPGRELTSGEADALLIARHLWEDSLPTGLGVNQQTGA